MKRPFTTIKENDVTFDAAFDEAVGSTTPDNSGDTGDGNADTTTTGDDSNDGIIKTAGDDTTAVDSTKSNDKEVKVPATDSTSTKDAATTEFASSLDAIQKSINEIKAQKVEPPADTNKVEDKVEPPAVDAEWEAFEKDWPEVAAIVVKEREAIATKVKALVAEALKPYESQLGVIVEKNQNDELDKFVSQVKQSHPDAMDILPNLLKWVETQPKHIAIGITHVLENSGDPKEVIAIYDNYKESLGIKSAKDDTGDAKVDEGLLSRMETVRSKRIAVNSETIGEDDFDGAFAQAVQQIK